MNRTATCHTEGCANSGLPIDLGEDIPDPNVEPGTVVPVACGVCGQLIDDVTGGDAEPEPQPNQPEGQTP